MSDPWAELKALRQRIPEVGAGTPAQVFALEHVVDLVITERDAGALADWLEFKAEGMGVAPPDEHDRQTWDLLTRAAAVAMMIHASHPCARQGLDSLLAAVVRSEIRRERQVDETLELLEGMAPMPLF